MRVIHQKYGIRIANLSLQLLFEDAKHGTWIALVTPRQQVEMRITKSGLLKLSKPRKPFPHELENYKENA